MGDVAGWKSDDDQNRKFEMSGDKLVVGDWFHLTKGKPVDMQVLVGERPGGSFYCHLLIEQDGIEYPKDESGGPILPIFKTAAIPEKLIPQMKVESEICSLDGPSFGVLK